MCKYARASPGKIDANNEIPDWKMQPSSRYNVRHRCSVENFPVVLRPVEKIESCRAKAELSILVIRLLPVYPYPHFTLKN